MVIIVVTVITQGALVPSEDRGSFTTPLLTINGGIFQAIGVISFGMFTIALSLLGTQFWFFYLFPVQN